MIQHIRHILSELSHIDPYLPTKCYNYNHTYVDWSKYPTTKGMKHPSLRDNHIRECVHFNKIETPHIPGKVNAFDVFTKELSGGAHFRAL